MDFADELVETVPHRRRYALSLTKGDHSAEDLVQDTIVRALEYRHTYKPVSTIRAWAFSIMYSLRVNNARRAAIAAKYVDRLRTDDVAPASQEHALTLKRALAALETMPEREEIVSAALGYTHAHRAAEGTPEGTSKSRLSRGRHRLKRMVA